MKARTYYIDENALIEKLLPKIEEKVRTDVIKNLISALEDQLYPHENAFKEGFITRVKKAAKGKGKVFKTASDLEVYLKNIGG